MIPVWYVDSQGTITGREQRDANSLAETARLENEHGVYLAAHTMQGGQVLLLDKHFDRMERSASGLGQPIRIPRSAIRKHLGGLRNAMGFSECRFRVIAILDPPVRYAITMEPYPGPPSWIKTDGVQTTVLHDTIRTQPEIKSTEWLVKRSTEGAYEALLCNTDGVILEGTSANFYGVLPNIQGQPQMRTSDWGVLAGISRSIVLTVALEIIEISGVPIRCDELGNLQEAFLSSATRGVFPIRRIDEIELPAPGPVTQKISDAYDAWVHEHLEPLVQPDSYFRSSRTG